ncbi:MAG: MFS family permease, partial [Acidimicrobiales bacterium]
MNRKLLPYYLLVAVVMMAMGGIFTLLGELRDQLGFSESGLGFMVAMGFFTAFFAQIGLARFSDRGHSTLMLRFGLGSVSIALALMAVATELWQFVLLRMLVGLGVGCLIPAARRLVIISDPDNVGANVGRLGAFDVGGFLVGPLVSALLANMFSFRAPFIFLAVVTAAFVPTIAKQQIDTGTVSEERQVVRVLLRLPAVRTMLVGAFGWFAMIGVFESVWAVMLTDRGADTWLIGVTMSLVMLPMLVIAPFSGRWAERVGPLRLVILGVLFVAPIFFSFGWIDSLLWLTLLATLQGCGDALVFPGSQVGMAVAGPVDLTASAQGLGGATLELTAGSMALVSGVLYERFGPQAVFSLGSGLMLAGVIGALVMA